MLQTSALMCHAPIVIPSIAGDREREVRASTLAMREAASRVVRSLPDALVLFSPHAPRPRSAYGIFGAERLEGTFERFGRPEIGAVLEGAPRLARAMAEAAGKAGAKVELLPDGTELDHGSLVPLWFLGEAGWCGPTVVVSLPAFPRLDDHERAGRAFAEALVGIRAAWVASGDMSHRLTADAPGGFHPRAKDFDRAVREAVERRAYVSVRGIDENLRELAGEDVLDTLLLAASATGGSSEGGEVLSYEAPFGVGYLVAILSGDQDLSRRLVSAARGALAQPAPRSTLAPRGLPWAKGVFVTLWSGNELRGCVGRFDRAFDADIELEVADCAFQSATSDTRFAPVTKEEARALRVEISLLGGLEPVSDPRAELDPDRWGVVVTEGKRRGTLLPGVQGVRTAAAQVSIAMRKAGITLGESVRVFRYPVVKITEGA